MPKHKQWFVVFLAGFFIFFISWIGDFTPSLYVRSARDRETLDSTIKLVFVGDVMMDRSVRRVVETDGAGDYMFLFKYIREMLVGADILFGNLEGPISDIGKRRGSIYSFRMDPISVEALRGVGFDIVSLANNHMGDYGREAMEDTFSRLGSAGILYVGAGKSENEAIAPVILERGGTRVGFLAFSDVGPVWMRAGPALSGIALADPDIITSAIRQARMSVDILVVSYHFGEEYKTHFQKRQEDLAHRAIDEGADIVIGHHPHVPEEIEYYKNGVIAYSLGNFIFDQAFSADTKRALLLKITLAKKKIIAAEPVPIVFNEYFQPIIKTLQH